MSHTSRSHVSVILGTAIVAGSALACQSREASTLPPSWPYPERGERVVAVQLAVAVVSPEWGNIGEGGTIPLEDPITGHTRPAHG